MPQNIFSKWAAFFRRFWLNKFSRSYVKEQLHMRQGECYQCGRCCRLIFQCPFLTQEGRCFIYNNGRPQQCRTFPLDMRDVAQIGSACGYYFCNEQLISPHEDPIEQIQS